VEMFENCLTCLHNQPKATLVDMSELTYRLAPEEHNATQK